MIIFHKYSTWFHFLSIFLLKHLYPCRFCNKTLFALSILSFILYLWWFIFPSTFETWWSYSGSPSASFRIHTLSPDNLLYLWVHPSSFVSGYQKGIYNFLLFVFILILILSYQLISGKVIAYLASLFNNLTSISSSVCPINWLICLIDSTIDKIA